MPDPDAGIVVLTSCTATKVAGHDVRTAESLYAGQQHLRLMRGVKAYRQAGQPAGRLKLRILSAGHGLLAANSLVAGYNTTFRGLPRDAIRRRAHELDIPRKIDGLLRKPYRLAFVLLGDDYLEACALNHELELGGPTLVFSGPLVGLKLPQLNKLRHIGVGNDEARRFSCAAVGLKGELGRRALTRLAVRPNDLASLSNPEADVLTWLDSYDVGSGRNGVPSGANP